MNYSEMSDHEINIAVIKKLGYSYSANDEYVERVFGGGDDMAFRKVDYCLSWGDIGPIIEGYKIDINHRESFKGGTLARQSGNSSVYHVDKNPKRAAAIVFLMMSKEQ